MLKATREDTSVLQNKLLAPDRDEEKETDQLQAKAPGLSPAQADGGPMAPVSPFVAPPSFALTADAPETESESEQETEEKTTSEGPEKTVAGEEPPETPAAPPPTGGGDTLPEDIKNAMGQSLKGDFSSVRIHQNSKPAQEMGALAFTQGKNVHFAPGQYNPKSKSGDQLLRHELVHVQQQQQGRVRPNKKVAGKAVNDDPALEREADQIAEQSAKEAPQAPKEKAPPKVGAENPYTGKDVSQPKMAPIQAKMAPAGPPAAPEAPAPMGPQAPAPQGAPQGKLPGKGTSKQAAAPGGPVGKGGVKGQAGAKGGAQTAAPAQESAGGEGPDAAAAGGGGDIAAYLRKHQRPSCRQDWKRSKIFPPNKKKRTTPPPNSKKRKKRSCLPPKKVPPSPVPSRSKR